MEFDSNSTESRVSGLAEAVEVQAPVDQGENAVSKGIFARITDALKDLKPFFEDLMTFPEEGRQRKPRKPVNPISAIKE